MVINDEGKLDLSPYEVEKLNNMINGIAYRHDGWAGLSAEVDIVPSLWCKVMLMLQKRTTSISMNYIARACYNGCIDLYKKQKFTNMHSFTSDDSMIGKVKEIGHTDPSSSLFSTSIENELNVSDAIDPEATLLVNDLLSMFPEGSSERTYISAVAQWEGLYGAKPESSGYKHKNYIISKLCGFASGSSSGYRSLKLNVRNAISKKYGNEGMMIELKNQRYKKISDKIRINSIGISLVYGTKGYKNSLKFMDYLDMLDDTLRSTLYVTNESIDNNPELFNYITNKMNSKIVNNEYPCIIIEHSDKKGVTGLTNGRYCLDNNRHYEKVLSSIASALGTRYNGINYCDDHIKSSSLVIKLDDEAIKLMSENADEIYTILSSDKKPLVGYKASVRRFISENTRLSDKISLSYKDAATRYNDVIAEKTGLPKGTRLSVENYSPMTDNFICTGINQPVPRRFTNLDDSFILITEDHASVYDDQLRKRTKSYLSSGSEWQVLDKVESTRLEKYPDSNDTHYVTRWYYKVKKNAWVENTSTHLR